MKKQNRAYIYAIITILCWSTMSSAFKITLRYIDYQLMLLIASFCSVLFLFTVILIQQKTFELKKTNLKNILNSAFLGLLNPLLYYLILFKSYDLLKAQIAGSLNYFWPVVLVLLSIPMLKQKIGFKSILALLISFFGIVIISTNGEIISVKSSDVLGITLALGSAIFWALYWICNMRDKREPLLKLFLNFCFGFLYILIIVLINGDVEIPQTKGIFGSIYTGIFEMGLTFLLWLKALSLSVNTAKVSNLVFLSPFIALLIIHLSIGEKILLSTFVGLFFIVAGIIIQKFINPTTSAN